MKDKIKESTAYKLMRLSENSDEDAVEIEEINDRENTEAEDFKRKYKDFYTDIKISIKEDW
jgi:hypothetical protein